MIIMLAKYYILSRMRQARQHYLYGSEFNAPLKPKFDGQLLNQMGRSKESKNHLIHNVGKTWDGVFA